MVEMSELWNRHLYKNERSIASKIFNTVLDRIDDPFSLGGTSFRYNDRLFFVKTKITRDLAVYQIEDWAENIIVPAESFKAEDEGWKMALDIYINKNIRKIIKEAYAVRISDDGIIK